MPKPSLDLTMPLRTGLTADVVILSREGLDELIREGLILPGGARDLAQTPLGLAVRAGDPKPDLTSVEGFKQAVLGAGTVNLMSTPALYLNETVFPSLGIADAVASKANDGSLTKLPSTNVVVLRPVSEIIHAPGLEFIGPVMAGSARPHQPNCRSSAMSSVKRIQFTAVINAPSAVVWRHVTSPESYRLWTSAFAEGSHFKGSWEQGAKILFLAPNGDGMVAEIAESRENEFVSIRHLGSIANGIQDTTSDAVKAWAPAYENYTFLAVPEGTRMVIDQDVSTEWEEYMNQAWPKALVLLKQLCESSARAN